MDLHTAALTASEIARQAGALLRDLVDQPHDEGTKDSVYDVVTEGDRQAEALILSALTRAFPHHHIIGEEGGGSGAPIASAAYRWYIDPVDGTTNFANNIPYFSVSIALADAQDQPLVGVVYSPVADELFCAVRSAGAWRNYRPIRVSAAAALERSVVCTGFPYDKATNPDNNLAEFSRFMPRVRGVRRLGSAALDLAWVACGRLDGFWEPRLNLWDCLAGVLLVREAGGVVTDYAGSNAGVQRGQIAASNGHIHAEMLAVLKGDAAG